MSLFTEVDRKGRTKKEQGSVFKEDVKKITIDFEDQELGTPVKEKRKGPIKCPESKVKTPLISLLDNSSDENSDVNSVIAPIQMSFDIKPSVRRVYKLIQKSTGALGGNGYDGAIYGELTIGSMQKVLNYMTSNCGMTAQSRFIDVGSGLGKPNFHAAQDPCVRLSIGIELEHIRWQLAMHNLAKICPVMCDDISDERDPLFYGVSFLQGDVFDTCTTDPFTHIYMYDLGFPPPLQQKIASNFNNSCHAEYLVSYRPPRRVINEYGYKVEFVGKMSTSMTGSGENHTAYFYRRTSAPVKPIARAGTSIVRLPRRLFLEEDDVDVVCDDVYKPSVLLSVSSLNKYRREVQSTAQQFLTTERPKRERKHRTIEDANFF